jgi:hypothetical protein
MKYFKKYLAKLLTLPDLFHYCYFIRTEGRYKVIWGKTNIRATTRTRPMRKG